ncbi:MAG: DUF3786 domain-containing protein [Planctomycetota bacterium]
MLHKELWQQLAGLDRQRTSQRAKCQYLSDCDCYVITLLNSEYRVDLIKKQVFLIQPGSVLMPAGFLEQLCILVYLINSKELPLANRLVKAESLGAGAFFFRGPHALPTSKLAEVFGAKPELLYEADKRFGAKKCDFGDGSVELLVLPRIPLTFVVWAGDEEFAARGSILFDQTASEQMPLDGLLSAVNLAVDAVISSVAPGG